MPRRVLIIDDDKLLRKIVKDILRLAEFEVLEAVDGTEGLDKAEHLHPDVILLDLIMPGLDGYEVCCGLKENPTTRDIPVIMVTTSTEVSLNARAYAAGALACIPKPFRREALIATIELALAPGARHPKDEEKPKKSSR
jgi:CheY-like chemotaxis protein